ncbi:MAG: MarR family transcriptional regulator [Oscillospiraceae bacterium]|nr:MarR family transcriptional regulator [Oscillospiraceae bacterium]
MEDKNFDCLKLENQMCFPLYACSKEIVRMYKPHLDKLDLTYTQYIAMMVLWEKKELSVKALGKCLFLDSGTLTPVLKKLETKGYINRTRSADDERSLNVSVTEAGVLLKEKAAEVPRKMSSCINLSPDEALQLYTLLNKLMDNFRNDADQ